MNDAHDHRDPSDEEASPEEIDWDQRVLCSDESCIGVVGPDGRCKECGRPFEGELPAGFSQSRADPHPAAPPGGEPAEVPQTEPRGEETPDNPETAAAADSESDADWENRTLCGDGNCIGVIGPDGRCKECGKPYHPETDE